MNEFGINRRRVEFVGDVQEHDDGFETPRADRAADVFWCSQLQKRHVWKCQVRQGKFFSGVQERWEPAGTHELKPYKPNGEMLLAVGCRDDRPMVRLWKCCVHVSKQLGSHREG